MHFASRLRKTGRPVVLAVNKAEGSAADATLLEASRLGFGEPVAISAEHGEGLAELYGALAPFDKEEEDVPPNEEAPENLPVQIAIVGRPNVGKSTLMNALLKEDRVLTGPEAGITRDAIAVPFTWRGRPIKLVDTAGMRRKANVQQPLERMSVGDSLRSIQYAAVVILVLDATQPLEHQDNVIAALVEREGRALILALNKWDLVKEKQKLLKALQDKLETTLSQLKGVRLVPISAINEQGLDTLMKEAFTVYETWNRRIATGEINRWLEMALAKHAPPLLSGRRLKIRYLTQTKTRPPSFTLFANTDDIPDHYLRYLTGSLRETFDLYGVPLRVTVKKPKNPYADKKKDDR
jgi:GTP-binding protein